jgi:hypothetical protein
MIYEDMQMHIHIPLYPYVSCVHYFDAEAGGRPSISKKKVYPYAYPDSNIF